MTSFNSAVNKVPGGKVDSKQEIAYNVLVELLAYVVITFSSTLFMHAEHSWLTLPSK